MFSTTYASQTLRENLCQGWISPALLEHRRMACPEGLVQYLAADLLR